jgi:hypothetical protein
MRHFEEPYWVADRKQGPLTTFSAINPRYWVIERATNSKVDEYTSKKAADLHARELNRAAEARA